MTEKRTVEMDGEDYLLWKQWKAEKEAEAGEDMYEDVSKVWVAGALGCPAYIKYRHELGRMMAVVSRMADEDPQGLGLGYRTLCRMPYTSSYDKPTFMIVKMLIGLGLVFDKGSGDKGKEARLVLTPAGLQFAEAIDVLDDKWIKAMVIVKDAIGLK